MEYTFSEKYKSNIILDKTFRFSMDIIMYAEELEKERKFVLANQILKSGTSIGANVKEAKTLKAMLILFTK